MHHRPTVAVYGGTFDPPGAHHRSIALQLKQRYDEIVILPCGPRPDKPSTNDTSPVHRAVMTDLTFRGIPRVRVELSDLEKPLFTPASEYDSLYSANADVSHVVAAEWVRGGRTGNSAIQKFWTEGGNVWSRFHFTVLSPIDDPVDPADLPPRHAVLEVEPFPPPSALRSRVYHQEDYDHLVVPEVARYIRRRNLFRGVPPGRESCFCPETRKCLVVYDERNPESVRLARLLEPYASTDDPQLIVALGGDGTMLHAIRQHWRRRVPIYGVNTGHLGFLLNDDKEMAFWDQELLLYQLPLLWVETEAIDGTVQSVLAFNDTWVERATGQTAWLRLSVNGAERLPKVVADGVLVATAAGSTAYARAMGATPVPFNMPALILAGSNVSTPMLWKPAVLPLESTVELTTLDTQKRPLQCYVDGVSQGLVKSVRVRASNTAAVELAFHRGHDPVTKLYRIQFPQEKAPTSHGTTATA
jgi:NAD+ kinase